MGDYTRFATIPKKWRFTINDETESLELNNNPVGLDDLRLSLTRIQNKSLVRGYSANLEYVFEGADKLMEWQKDKGVLKESYLKVDKIDTNTGEYDNVLTAKHDYVEYKELTQNKKGVSIPLIDSAFNEKLKNREDIDIAVDSDTNLDGDSITPIQYTDISLLGREFGQSDAVAESWFGDPENPSLDVYEALDSDFFIYRFNFGQDASNFINIQNVQRRRGSEVFGEEDKIFAVDCFYYDPFGNTDISFTVNMIGKLEGGFSRFYIKKGKFDESGAVIDGTVSTLEDRTDTNVGSFLNVNFTKQVTTTLEPGYGIWIMVYLSSSFNDKFTVYEGTNLNVDYFSKFDPTPCKVVLPHEVGEYLAEAITGEPNSFRSNYFGRTDIGYDEDGAGALIALTNGKLIRQLPTGNIQAEGEPKKAQLAFKFKEFFENFYKLKNISFEVVVEDGKHIIVAELQKDLFKTTVSHEFSFIEKGSFERVQDFTHFYSSIKAGYQANNEDLPSGLEEYNNIIHHSTILSTVQNELDLVCSYTAQGILLEKLRRQGNTSNELSGDERIFFIELIRDESDNLIQRNRQGFTDVIGLDGLETAINLGLTPKQTFYAHGWEINTGLAKFPSSIIKYNTSDKTTDLQLLKEGEFDYIVENQDVVAGTLENPIFTGFKVNFRTAISLSDYKIMQADANSLIAYPAQFGNTGLNYGWIDDVSTDPKDTDFNAVLIEANPPDVATEKVLATNKDKVIATNDDKLIGVS